MKITTKSFKPLGLALAIGASALLGSSASAAVIGQLGILEDTANGGINPETGEAWKIGDTYRLIFVTSTTTTAGSTNIADYNAFVDAAATAAGYGAVDWFALGSTATVDAIDNTGTTGTGVGIFDFLNTKIADSNTDLWDGSIDSLLTTTELKGTVTSGTRHWTGTDADGTKAADGRVLGGSGEATPRVQVGRNDFTSQQWMIQFSQTDFNTASLGMLAISQELTVVPEPSTTALLGLGGLALILRRRRA